MTETCHTIRRLVASMDLHLWRSIPIYICGDVEKEGDGVGGLGEDEEARRRLVAAAVSEDMLGRPFLDANANDDSFQIFPALEVKKRLNTRHQISTSSEFGAQNERSKFSLMSLWQPYDCRACRRV